MQPFVIPNTIFMTIAGSHMYGMATAASDIDKRGVCVPPYTHTLGFHNFEQQEVPGEDTVIFSLKKFMHLASDCNPNIIELLYAPDDCIQICEPLWKELLEHRDKFLSTKAYHTFCGYAHGQLTRVRNHRAWLTDPPTHKPTREEFGLQEHGVGARELAKGIDISQIDPGVQDLINRERKYKAALAHYNQYENWKATRNPKRAELEAKFHYDTKHASHLIRLLRMSLEILSEGKVLVRRPDAAELLAIRQGAWTYDELMEQVEKLRAKVDAIYENKTYVIPVRPDVNALSDLCANLHLKYYGLAA